MPDPKNNKNDFEKRAFIRLKSSLDAQFTIVRLQGDLPGLDRQKGTVKDISRGGLGLRTDELSESTIKYLNKQNILLEVKVSVPSREQPLRVVGEVAWHNVDPSAKKKTYLIGLKYHSIKSEDLNLLLSLAQH